jgi:Domain of unknown function (DUF397)
MNDEVVTDWRVATYTGGQGNCVEVGRSATAVAVRDTKDRDSGPVLRFDPAAWRTFTRYLKSSRSRVNRPRPKGLRPERGLRMPADQLH